MFDRNQLSAGLNALVTARIKSGQINSSHLNVVEVNNVCDGGQELLAVIRAIP